MTADKGPRPLVVDLDGTLVKSDLLVESSCALIARSPWRVMSMAAWIVRGPAHLKRRVAQLVDVDAALLPYNREVLARIEAARRDSRPVFLASASDDTFVAAVAQHLGFFAGWFGSDGRVNLRGVAKARCLTSRFGRHGFDYVGDHAIDLPVWAEAHTAIAVDPSPSLAKSLGALGCAVDYVRTDEPARAGTAWLRLLRPHQWTKNSLVTVALLTSHRVSVATELACLAAFAAFSLCASSVYILNDIVDLPSDRSHPSKRNRPLASGAVPILQALLLAPILLAASFLLALSISTSFAAALGVYYIATTAYSLWLKRKMMIDVVTLAGLYTIRVIAGAIAIDVVVSQWILAFSMFIFLCLALVKRYSELATRLDSGLPDPTNRNYKIGDLPVILSLAASAGYSAVIVLSLYVASDAVVALYRWPQLLWLAVPLLVYWISRLLMMTHRRFVHEDPVVFALRDRVSLLAGLTMLLLMAVAMLSPPP